MWRSSTPRKKCLPSTSIHRYRSGCSSFCVTMARRPACTTSSGSATRLPRTGERSAQLLHDVDRSLGLDGARADATGHEGVDLVELLVGEFPTADQEGLDPRRPVSHADAEQRADIVEEVPAGRRELSTEPFAVEAVLRAELRVSRS